MEGGLETFRNLDGSFLRANGSLTIDDESSRCRADLRRPRNQRRLVRSRHGGPERHDSCQTANPTPRARLPAAGPRHHHHIRAYNHGLPNIGTTTFNTSTPTNPTLPARLSISVQDRNVSRRFRLK